jgi:hypothetical protein
MDGDTITVIGSYKVAVVIVYIVWNDIGAEGMMHTVGLDNIGKIADIIGSKIAGDDLVCGENVVIIVRRPDVVSEIAWSGPCGNGLR